MISSVSHLKTAKHTSNQLVRYETQGPVSIVSLNRPAKRNAINRQMATELLDAIDQFERDDMAKVCVLYGNGGSFSAGHDMKEPIDDDDPTSLLNMVNIIIFKNKQN